MHSDSQTPRTQYADILQSRLEVNLQHAHAYLRASLTTRRLFHFAYKPSLRQNDKKERKHGKRASQREWIANGPGVWYAEWNCVDVRGLTVEGEGQCNCESTASRRRTGDGGKERDSRLVEIEPDNVQSKQW